jgi:Ras-related protein Rab-1A
MYFRDAVVIIMVFDLTQRSSFGNIPEWVSTAESTAPENAQIFLIGNKSDLHAERVVDYNEAEDMAESVHAFTYLETSAKTGEGLPMFLTKLGQAAEKAADGSPVIQQQVAPPISLTLDATQPRETNESGDCC